MILERYSTSNGTLISAFHPSVTDRHEMRRAFARRDEEARCLERIVGILDSIPVDPAEWAAESNAGWEVDGWPLQIFRAVQRGS